MSLFQTGKFLLHSGRTSKFKIDCDALTYQDWDSLARLVADKTLPYSYREIVAADPNSHNATRFADALKKMSSLSETSITVLVVDDVLTTGGTLKKKMEEYAKTPFLVDGLVVFARGSLPVNCAAIFTLNGFFEEI